LFHFLSLLTKYILVAFASILQKLNQAWPFISITIFWNLR
jgi:hypothetical protein